MEVAIGAALAGERAMVSMKHVGVNVAADPLFTVSYTGIEGALVIVSADDPSLHSSQNEQDNRNYARFAKIPMLEPGDSEEARKYVKLAVAMSEQFDTPVFLRSYDEGIPFKIDCEHRGAGRLYKTGQNSAPKPLST